MRVLHFSKTYFPDTFGGVEQVINQIARGSAKLGVICDVLALSRAGGPPTIEIDGHRVYRVRHDFEFASNAFSISAFSRFAQLAKEADVVHFHFPWPFMDLVHFATRVGKPTVVTYHSDIIRQKQLLKIYAPFKRRFLASIDCIVATSPNYVQSSAVLSRFANKVRVIPIGLDRASYPPSSPERLESWRKQVGPKFFLFVGMLRYYKGLHILLEAAQDTDYPIVIVGAGPVEQELKAQALRLGLKNIHFLGQQSEADKIALLTLCYSVVFPSHLRSEAFGISLLEGAMFGKPMISSEIGTGTTYINVAGETGLVIPPSDPVALRDAMRYLWEHPCEANKMGLSGEQRYWDHFTADKMAEAYVRLYRELVEQRPAIGS